MIFEQLHLGCLSQASYVVADEASRRAMVVDPRRDIDDYLDFAREHALAIELVVLATVHADVVPGHLELEAATGAQIAMGRQAPVDFPLRRLDDCERITLGDPDSGGAVEILATHDCARPWPSSTRTARCWCPAPAVTAPARRRACCGHAAAPT